MKTGIVPEFICSRCFHRCGFSPFYREPGFVACSEGCYNLAREADLQEALEMREVKTAPWEKERINDYSIG